MDYYVAPNQWGTPTDGGEFSYEVFQGNQPACAVYSQYNVLKDYGFTGTPEDLIQEATEKGWYDPDSGTSLENIGKLLESHGVECDMYVNASRYNLFSELAKGKKVIVTVDSSELWNDGKLSRLGEMLKDIVPGDGSDHALVVTGFNTADPNNAQVTLMDSGSGQAAVSYPIKRFEDAWSDGHCTMIVPKEAPSADLQLPHMAHLENVEEYLDDNDHFSLEKHSLSEFEHLDVGVGENWEDCVQEYYRCGEIPDLSGPFSSVECSVLTEDTPMDVTEGADGLFQDEAMQNDVGGVEAHEVDVIGEIFS